MGAENCFVATNPNEKIGGYVVTIWCERCGKEDDFVTPSAQKAIINGQIPCKCACESKQQSRYRIQSLFYNKPFDWKGCQSEAPLLAEMPYAKTSMAASV